MVIEGTRGEAGRPRTPAAHASGALWGLPGAAQPPARRHHPDATPARDRGRGTRHRVAALELGTTAQTRLCAGYGALPVLPAGDAADHCRHHARRGHPEAPPASETYRSPLSHCPGPCPPGSLRLVLGLTAPRVSPTRLRPLPWAGTTPPSPAPPAVSLHTARGWGGMAVRRPRLQ